MRPRPRLVAAALLGVLIAAWLAAPAVLSSRLRRAAAARGLVLRWERLRVRPPLRAELRGVTLSSRASGCSPSRRWAMR